MSKKVEIADQVDGALTMRPYQQDVYDEALDKLAKSNRHSVFVVSPPGSGKTLIMAELAKKYTDEGKDVLVVVHRQTIVAQITKTFERQGVNMDLATIGMIGSQANKAIRGEKAEPSLLLIDEAHHAEAETYQKLVRRSPNADKMLFSATPWRGDGKGFEDIVSNDDMVRGPSVQWLIDNGYLSDFDYYTVQLIDKDNIEYSQKTGEFVRESADEEANKINPDDVVDKYIELGDNKPGLVYAATVFQSERIVDAFNERGITAVHLDGASSDEERQEAIDKYKRGEIQVISNVMLFTEGVDLPQAYVAMIVRPTRSVAMYFQFSMRVLRPMEGKRAKIIDFVGVASDLGLPNRDFDWTLRARDRSEFKSDRFTIVGFDNVTYDIRDLDSKHIEGNGSAAGKMQYFEPVHRKLVYERLMKSPSEASAEELSDEKDLMPIEDYEDFYLRWLMNQKFDKRNGLKTNIEIWLMSSVDTKCFHRSDFRPNPDHVNGITTDKDIEVIKEHIHDSDVFRHAVKLMFNDYMYIHKKPKPGQRRPEHVTFSKQEVHQALTELDMDMYYSIFVEEYKEHVRFFDKLFYMNLKQTDVDPLRDITEFVRILNTKFRYDLEEELGYMGRDMYGRTVEYKLTKGQMNRIYKQVFNQSYQSYEKEYRKKRHKESEKRISDRTIDNELSEIRELLIKRRNVDVPEFFCDVLEFI